MLKKAGYKPFDRKASYVPGDKEYVVNREKAVIATTFGKKPLKDGLRINGAHIDAPRLDLKPNPLYEKEDIAYFKTHYYGFLNLLALVGDGSNDHIQFFSLKTFS